MLPDKCNLGRLALALLPLINQLHLDQINCMELFAADRKQVDSGWGLGRMPGCLLMDCYCVFTLPFFNLAHCCASLCHCKLLFWTTVLFVIANTKIFISLAHTVTLLL